MARPRIVLNRAGVRDLLRSSAAAGDLEQRARRIAAAAGPGHEVSVSVGANRARASVWTSTYEARRAEAETRSLTRAVEAGR